MHVRITIETRASRQQIEDRLVERTADGPFAVRDLLHLGAGVWSVTLEPVRPGLAVGFAKVAELQLLLVREFDVYAVERLPSTAPAVAG
jgi:hypothetical protein